jgi:hypothetical protein
MRQPKYFPGWTRVSDEITLVDDGIQGFRDLQFFSSLCRSNSNAIQR